MIVVSQAELLDAAELAADVAATGLVDAHRWVRVSYDGKTAHFTAAAGTLATSRHLQPLEGENPEFNVAVHGDRFLAACKALRKDPVSLEIVDGGLRIVQKSGLEAGLETLDASQCPTIQGFEGMRVVYQGENPGPAYSSIRNIASTHPGTTPLSRVLLLLPGRSYLASSTSAVRCDYSLVGSDQAADPFGVPLGDLWFLDKMEDTVSAYLEATRLLVVDEHGWVTVQTWADNVSGFAQSVERTFASLRQIGQVKIPRAEALRCANAAQTVLKGATKEAVFLLATCEPERVSFSASVGRHSYRETIKAWSSGRFEIPVHVGRLVDFLRGSEDEGVFLRVMSSDQVPEPMSFVHLVDSRLHEVVGLPHGTLIKVQGLVQSGAGDQTA